jgi:glyoxylase-like metal-dependent hydrolase (beta-lactamase superfamily II)
VRIHSISTGHVQVHPSQVRGRGTGLARRLTVLRDTRWTPPLPIHAWAIEHPEGLILVDTGEVHEASDPRHYPAAHPYFRRALRFDLPERDEIDQQLLRLGLSAEQVRWVVLTHLHTDHAGGLRHFPAAEIVVAADELAAARGLRGRLRGYLPQMWPRWLAPRTITFRSDPVGDFPASHPLTEAGDVLLVPTPGHTHGHLSVLVRRPGRPTVLLAGDASYTQQLMLEGAVDGVAIDERAAHDTLLRLQRFTRADPTVYLPAHDPASADRYRLEQTVPA